MIAVRLLVDGAVVRETVFRDGPVAIGRDPESDFAIVDPSVSRHHARIRTDETGATWIEDAGGRNGLRVGGERVERAPIPAGGAIRCRLGSAEVELALASADATVEIVAPPPSVPGPMRALKALAFWAAGVAAWAGLMLFSSSFWSPWEQDRLATLAWVTLSASVGLPVLAFVLIGLLRIVGRKARLAGALRVLALVSWGWVLLAVLESAASYLLSVGVHSVLAALLRNGALVMTVASLASVARPGPKRRFFAAWAVAIAVLLAGFNAAAHLAARQAGTPQVDYDMNVPIAGVSGPASDLDRYLEGARADFKIAERRAEEERRNLQPSQP
jgi:hypothetical protein